MVRAPRRRRREAASHAMKSHPPPSRAELLRTRAAAEPRRCPAVSMLELKPPSWASWSPRRVWVQALSRGFGFGRS